MDIPVFKPSLGSSEKEKVAEAIESGWISSSGGKITEFEDEVRDFLGVQDGWATDSGTAALQTALESVGVKGRKVIIPGLTFGATALAVRQAGGEPIPVDIEEDTMGIDPGRLEERVGEETAAIVVVHLFGHSSDMDEIEDIAEREDIPVIEDAAQAFGSDKGGKRLGTHGAIGIFSFSWNKSITTGKGGFITASPRYREKVKEKVMNGLEDGRKFEKDGYHYRMDSLRAGIGLSQIQRYGEMEKRKQEIFDLYREELGDIEHLETPPKRAGEKLWCFYVLTKERDGLQKHLEQQGIGTRVFYPPVTELGVVEADKDLAVAGELSDKGLILPSYPGLGTADARKVCREIEEYYRNI